MIGNLVIFGDSCSTYKGHIPEGYAFYYFPEEAAPDEAVKSMELDQTWWRRFIKESGANLIRNDSWSGSTICYTGYLGDCSSTSSFIYRYRHLKSEGLFEKNKIDTVIVFGGTNDSWVPAELGKDRGADTEEDLYYALPAIRHFMKTLKKDLPGVRIVFIANCDINEEIVGCMLDEGERLGIEVVRLHGVDKMDGHPTVLGMQQISDQVLEVLGEKR